MINCRTNFRVYVSVIYAVHQCQSQTSVKRNFFNAFCFDIAAVGGMASSQLSQINSVTAQSGGKDVDEFDMLAQSRNDAKS